ncbi:MAG: SGNH/GDSL hydrolase family protein, partial [Planctomycetes bacterium]|nr:SGNH/GDSL hydrolase family protein [Planctomycetota bacterium]
LLLAACGCGGIESIRIQRPAVRYVAFGDSTTAGPTERDYVDVLQDLLGESEEAFANEGESGEGTQDGLTRLRELLALEVYPNAEVLFYWEGGIDIIGFIREHDPFLVRSPEDAAFAFAGELNEMLDAVETNVADAIDAAQDAGLEVYLATYFPLSPGLAKCDPLPLDILIPFQADHANVYITMLNDRLRATAARRGATIVDVAARADELLADRATYFDCNHLSEAGNEIVGRVFFDALTDDD